MKIVSLNNRQRRMASWSHQKHQWFIPQPVGGGMIAKKNADCPPIWEGAKYMEVRQKTTEKESDLSQPKDARRRTPTTKCLRTKRQI